MGCYLGFEDLKVAYGGLKGLILGCEALSGDCEGLNGFFELGDPKGLVHKVLNEGGVGLLKVVDFELLLILCLKEGSKACTMGCKGYGVVFQSLSVLGSV